MEMLPQVSVQIAAGTCVFGVVQLLIRYQQKAHLPTRDTPNCLDKKPAPQCYPSTLNGPVLVINCSELLQKGSKEPLLAHLQQPLQSLMAMPDTKPKALFPPGM